MMNIVKYIIDVITGKIYRQNMLTGDNEARFIKKVIDMPEYDPRRIFVWAATVHAAMFLDGIYFGDYKNNISKNINKITKEKGLEIFKVIMGLDFQRMTEFKEYNKTLGDSSLDPAMFEKEIFKIIEYSEKDILSWQRIKGEYNKAKKHNNYFPFYNEIYKMLLEIIYGKESPKIDATDLVYFTSLLSDSTVQYRNIMADLLKKHIYKEADVDINRINFGKYYYLMNYYDHYCFLLEGFDEGAKAIMLKELFCFRSWITQFTLRLPFLNTKEEEKLLHEVVNLTVTLGRGMFAVTHNNTEIGKEMIYERWEDYDLIVEGMKSSENIPVEKLCGKMISLCGLSVSPKSYEMLIKDTQNLIAEMKKDENYIILTSGL